MGVVIFASAALMFFQGRDRPGDTEPAVAATPASPTTTASQPARTVEGDSRQDSVDILPVIPGEIYDPVAAGEPTPSGFRQVLPRDAILPIYNPRFVSAVDAGWTDDTLIIGLELEGEAKAYPVSFLNRREMVIDWIGGTPVLVSW